MKKILMLLQSEFPPDIRLEKEIKSLSEAGHKVVLFCNQYNKRKQNNFEFCSISRLASLTNSTKINKIINFPIIFNLRMLLSIVRTYKSFKPDIVHVHDLPMLPFGVVLKTIFKTKLIFDMHENYSAALKSYRKKSFFERVIKNYRVAEFIENILIPKADSIITVVEESSAIWIKRGISTNKIIEVSNTVNLGEFGKQDIDTHIIKKYSNNFIIIYTGRISFNRGLITPILSLKYLVERIPEIKFLIIGDGAYLSTLKDVADSENVNDYVEFLKWPGHDKIHSFMSIADICLIPQPSNGHADTTVPHKLFEYMSQNKPILTSDAKPLKRIMDETKAGLSFRSNDTQDFADKIIKIKSSDIDFGINGVQAVNEKYNWRVDEEKLLSLYK